MIKNNKKNMGAVLQPVLAALVALPAISSVSFMMVTSELETAAWEDMFQPERHELMGVRIGMTDLEVKIAIGEPVVDKEDPSAWLYSDGDLYIRFNENRSVSAVCYPPVETNPLLNEKVSEAEIRERFGKPVSESVHESGLKKVMNYRVPHYSVGIQLNKAQLVCVHDGDGVHYDNEYRRG